MPKGSCLRTTLDERLGEGWTVTDDLLALLVEVTSVSASGRQLKKPIEVPRPEKPKPKPDARAVEAPQSERDAAFKRGIGVLAATSKAVKR